MDSLHGGPAAVIHRATHGLQVETCNWLVRVTVQCLNKLKMFEILGYVEGDFTSFYKAILEDTGPLRGPTSSSCGGHRPLAQGFFCPSDKKKDLIMLFWPILGHL